MEDTSLCTTLWLIISKKMNSSCFLGFMVSLHVTVNEMLHISQSSSIVLMFSLIVFHKSAFLSCSFLKLDQFQKCKKNYNNWTSSASVFTRRLQPDMAHICRSLLQESYYALETAEHFFRWPDTTTMYPSYIAVLKFVPLELFLVHKWTVNKWQLLEKL